MTAARTHAPSAADIVRALLAAAAALLVLSATVAPSPAGAATALTARA